MKNILTAFFAIMVSTAASAGTDDKVLEVYSCSNDIGIKMQNAGWVVALESQNGQKRVDRIQAIALVLLTTGKSTGYFDDAAGVQWCGTIAKPITVLSAKS